jgi:hypothetical protein
MIHCTTEDLLALKDHEGTAWARKHLGECAECRAEMDALHQRVASLKALSAVTPPRDRWPLVRDRVLAERRQRRATHVRWAAVAVAASLVAVIGTRAYDKNRMETRVAAEVDSLMSRNQVLTAKLREIDPESRVLTGATAGFVAGIEDGIGEIDAEIGQPVQTVAGERHRDLLRNRVELMQGLVNVYSTRHASLGM